MMTNLCSEVLDTLRRKGMTLATAESLTGGWIGSSLTAVPGASDVYVGGVISYVNAVKQEILGVEREILDSFGAVSEPTARAMASGVRKMLKADAAVSVTGLAGPTGDGFGNPVGTVYIGYAGSTCTVVRKHLFSGNRQEIRSSTVQAALELILEMNS